MMTCFPKGSSIHDLRSLCLWLRFLLGMSHNSALFLCAIPFNYSKAVSILDFVIKKKLRMYRSNNRREL